MHIDVACLIVLALFGLIGFLKGFLSQLISIAAIVTGLLGAMFFSVPTSNWAVGWLAPRAPALHPTLIRIGVFVVLLFSLYILVAATLEAVKKKLMHTFALQMNDRLLGLLVGLAKGVALVLFVVLVMDGTKGLVERLASARGFERYQAAMDASDVVSGSRYLIGFSRDQSPALSEALHRAELWLPPAQQTNKPAQKISAPILTPAHLPGASTPPAASATVRTSPPMPFTPPASSAVARTNQPIPFTPPALPGTPVPGRTP